MRSFCLAIDTELRIFDVKCSIISIIAIDRDYILEDIVYDFGFERLIVVCSKDDFVRQLIFTDDWTESDLKVKLKGLRQVILDSSGRWCSFNHESVLQVFAKDNQLAEVKLENDGQLCSFAKDGEVIVAVAKADGNILGYFPLGPNNEKDTTQLDPMWQVGCGQSDDETRWKVHNSENRVFVQREDTFSICEKYGDNEFFADTTDVHLLTEPRTGEPRAFPKCTETFTYTFHSTFLLVRSLHVFVVCSLLHLRSFLLEIVSKH